jgi:hypothetical protein
MPNDTERPSSPYAAPLPEEARDARIPGGEKPKIRGDGVPEPAAIREFMETVAGATDRVEAAVDRAIATGSGAVKVTESVEAPGDLTPAHIMAKVVAFLDNKTHGPITILGPIRHKLFVMRIPRQQEMIEVTAFAGTTLADAADSTLGKLKVADQTWTLIGELQKACFGYLSERSPQVAALKQNIATPEKWPALRSPEWLTTRDPYVLEGEVYPLWAAYKEWRNAVVPTVEELDFYWANQE